MQYVLLIALVVVLTWFVTAPLRRPATEADPDDPSARIAELEIRKEAKYREIRDAQLDHASGKLSDADHATLDAELRREAIGILKELDRAGATVPRDSR